MLRYFGVICIFMFAFYVIFTYERQQKRSLLQGEESLLLLKFFHTMSYTNDGVNDLCKSIRTLSLITGLKIISLILMPTLAVLDQAMYLVFSFVFAILECVFGIPLINKMFDTFSDVALYENNAECANNTVVKNITIGAFVARFDPTLEELNDIKTAVSEAVTNCIVHAYRDKIGKIYITVSADGEEVKIKIKDNGCGIEDVERAKQPLFTTGGEERAGLGFAVMESFTDKLKVRSAVGKGTTVTMQKKLNVKNDGKR